MAYILASMKNEFIVNLANSKASSEIKDRSFDSDTTISESHSESKQSCRLLDFLRSKDCINDELSSVCSAFAEPKNPLKANTNSSNEKYKTKFCKNFISNSICRFGDSCDFAHSEAELRSSRKAREPKPCQKFLKGFCSKGKNCIDSHKIENSSSQEKFQHAENFIFYSITSGKSLLKAIDHCNQMTGYEVKY